MLVIKITISFFPDSFLMFRQWQWEILSRFVGMAASGTSFDVESYGRDFVNEILRSLKF